MASIKMSLLLVLSWQNMDPKQSLVFGISGPSTDWRTFSKTDLQDTVNFQDIRDLSGHSHVHGMAYSTG